ncbi:hypothetical protein RJT34_10625 [Clitoria ternatea]|uniref:Uncharacterized protein n=1 Tax=Clitoria ternatea TaxID=43366 RepID=A0AAN9JKU0_CLITE
MEQDLRSTTCNILLLIFLHVKTKMHQILQLVLPFSTNFFRNETLKRCVHNKLHYGRHCLFDIAEFQANLTF